MMRLTGEIKVNRILFIIIITVKRQQIIEFVYLFSQNQKDGWLIDWLIDEESWYLMKKKS